MKKLPDGPPVAIHTRPWVDWKTGHGAAADFGARLDREGHAVHSLTLGDGATALVVLWGMATPAAADSPAGAADPAAAWVLVGERDGPSQWREGSVRPDAPTVDYASVAHDRQIWGFGGIVPGSGKFSGALWRVSVDSDGALGIVTLDDASGERPPALAGASLSFDLLKESLLLVGGLGADARISRAIYRYSVRDHAWEVLTSDDGPPCAFHTAVLANVSADTPADNTETTIVCHGGVAPPETPSEPAPLSRGACAALAGHGIGAPFRFTGATWAVSTATGAATRLETAGPVLPRATHVAALLASPSGPLMLVAGGVSLRPLGNAGTLRSDAASVLNIHTRRWSPLPSLETPETANRWLAAACVVAPGTVLVHGGAFLPAGGVTTAAKSQRTHAVFERGHELELPRAPRFGTLLQLSPPVDKVPAVSLRARAKGARSLEISWRVGNSLKRYALAERVGAAFGCWFRVEMSTDAQFDPATAVVGLAYEGCDSSTIVHGVVPLKTAAGAADTSAGVPGTFERLIPGAEYHCRLLLATLDGVAAAPLATATVQLPAPSAAAPPADIRIRVVQPLDEDAGSAEALFMCSWSAGPDDGGLDVTSFDVCVRWSINGAPGYGCCPPPGPNASAGVPAPQLVRIATCSRPFFSTRVAGIIEQLRALEVEGLDAWAVPNLPASGSLWNHRHAELGLVVCVTAINLFGASAPSAAAAVTFSLHGEKTVPLPSFYTRDALEALCRGRWSRPEASAPVTPQSPAAVSPRRSNHDQAWSAGYSWRPGASRKRPGSPTEVSSRARPRPYR